MLTADVKKANASEVTPLIPEQVLKKDDEVALNVELDHDAYVYVVYVDAQGNVNDLYPAPEKATQEAIVHRGRQRLPRGGRWRLDAAKGTESFVVFAAPTPLDDAARRGRAEKFRRPAPPERKPTMPDARRALKPAPCPGPQNPALSDDMCDEDHRSPHEISEEVVAEPDRDGITTAVFTIKHR